MSSDSRILYKALFNALPFLFREGPFSETAALDGIPPSSFTEGIKLLRRLGYVSGPYVVFPPALGFGISLISGEMDDELTLLSFRSDRTVYSIAITEPGEHNVERLLYRAITRDEGVVEVDLDLSPHTPPNLDKEDHSVILEVSRTGRSRNYWRFRKLREINAIQKRWVISYLPIPLSLTFHPAETLPEPDPACVTLFLRDGSAVSFHFTEVGPRSIPVFFGKPLSFRVHQRFLNS